MGDPHVVPQKVPPRVMYIVFARMQSSARERRGSGREAAIVPVEVSYTSYPVSVTDTMYKDQRVRKAIDECAFRYGVDHKLCLIGRVRLTDYCAQPNTNCRIYGHWVKKSNAQNRAALFENYLVRHAS